MEVLELASEFGPLVFILVFSILKGAKIGREWMVDQREFNQDITRGALQGEFGGSKMDTKITEISAKLDFQSEKMEKIEVQTTNHVSEIQDDIKKMKKDYHELDKKVVQIQECLNNISDKLE